MGPREAVSLSRSVIGPKLRVVRQSRGLSLRETARRVEIDNGHLCRIEAGEFDLKASTLLRLLAVYDADITDVWPRKEPPE